jgi:hypothetical protein
LFYAGSLSLTGILISYFSPDNTGVGFLALAFAISRPLELVPNAIATAYFKDFSTQKALSVGLLIHDHPAQSGSAVVHHLGSHRALYTDLLQC